MRDFRYGRVCFKPVKALGALQSKLWKRPRPLASVFFKAKNVELLGLHPIRLISCHILTYMLSAKTNSSNCLLFKWTVTAFVCVSQYNERQSWDNLGVMVCVRESMCYLCSGQPSNDSGEVSVIWSENQDGEQGWDRLTWPWTSLRRKDVGRELLYSFYPKNLLFSIWSWLRAIWHQDPKQAHNFLITAQKELYMRSCSWNVTDSNKPIFDIIIRGQVLDMIAQRNISRVSSSVSATIGLRLT